MKKMNTKISVVGVGRMGANMARRLADVGYTIAGVHDADRAKAASLAEELRCLHAGTPADAAQQADIVFTVVTDDAAMRRIYDPFSPESLAAHARNRLFINCATVSPQTHIDIERLVEERGGRVLEACMASSIPQARQGTLYLMVGGRRDVFEEAKPILEPLSAAVRYIGPAGQAAVVKALVNMVMNINTAGLAEGLGLGAAMGIDLTLLREVFSQTGANSRVLETDGEDMQNRSHDCYFSAAHAAKDSGIALALARSVGLDLPLAQATFEQYSRLVQRGKGELDKSGIAELTFRDRVAG